MLFCYSSQNSLKHQPGLVLTQVKKMKINSLNCSTKTVINKNQAGFNTYRGPKTQTKIIQLKCNPKICMIHGHLDYYDLQKRSIYHSSLENIVHA